MTIEQYRDRMAEADRKRRLNAAIDRLIAAYADETGVVPRHRLGEYQPELRRLRVRFE